MNKNAKEPSIYNVSTFSGIFEQSLPPPLVNTNKVLKANIAFFWTSYPVPTFKWIRNIWMVTKGKIPRTTPSVVMKEICMYFRMKKMKKKTKPRKYIGCFIEFTICCRSSSCFITIWARHESSFEWRVVAMMEETRIVKKMIEDSAARWR